MAGFLPDTKPVASNYGEELEDSQPIADPKREIGADVLNPMRHDLAFVARMSFRLAIVVDIGANVEAIFGPEGAAANQVVIVDNGDGNHEVDWSATGVAGYGVVFPLDGDCQAYILAKTSTTMHKRTLDGTLSQVSAAYLILVL